MVECPSLPGCLSQGRTNEEARENIKEAIQVYTEALVDQGLLRAIIRQSSLSTAEFVTLI